MMHDPKKVVYGYLTVPITTCSTEETKINMTDNMRLEKVIMTQF